MTGIITNINRSTIADRAMITTKGLATMRVLTHTSNTLVRNTILFVRCQNGTLTGVQTGHRCTVYGTEIICRQLRDTALYR